MSVKRKPAPHPKQTKTPETITYRLIKEFKREALNESLDKGRNQIVWWVVQWCRQENAVFEKRRIYVSSRTGTVKTYKQVPLHLQDMAWIAANWKEIIEALQS